MTKPKSDSVTKTAINQALVKFMEANPGAGRHKLIKATGASAYQASHFLRLWHRDHGTMPSRGGNQRRSKLFPGEVLNRRPTPAVPAAADAGAGLKGIALVGLRVSATRPNEGLKALIFGLRKGTGYPVEALAQAWNTSPENVRKHGRRHGAIVWAETGPGDWSQCLAHPETAAEFNKRSNQGGRN